MDKQSLREYSPPENRVNLKEMTVEVAEKMLETAEDWCSKEEVPSSIAVVDNSGAIVALHRMDDSLLGGMTPDIAISKAYTAGVTGTSTYNFAKVLDPRQIPQDIVGSYYGPALLTQLKGRLNLIPGGEPVRNMDGKVIGGIGVSGVPVGIGDISDTTACQAGISALYD